MQTLALAESNNVAVLRGWGAAHLLRPIPHVICVRVGAPIDLRIKRMTERLDTDDVGLITNEIRLSEEAHGAITRRHLGVNWQDAEHYDLVLNTERVSIEECADAVMCLVKQPEFQPTVQSLQMLADLALESRVRAALRADPRTKNMQITINADRGNVALAGVLEPGLEALHAIEVTAAVPKVQDVRSELKPSMPSRLKLDA